MPTHICANKGECIKYKDQGGKYNLGRRFGFTVDDGPCHFCQDAKEEEKRKDAFEKETALVQYKEMAARAEQERKQQAAQAEHNRKEQAAQAEHDREMERVEKKSKADKERLDRVIVLQAKKRQQANEAREHDLKIKSMMHELNSKSLEKEAEERRRKDELAKIEVEYKGKIELKKLEVQQVRLEIELLKMMTAQEEEGTAVDNVPEDGETADREESSALLPHKSCKTKAKELLRELRELRRRKR